MMNEEEQMAIDYLKSCDNQVVRSRLKAVLMYRKGHSIQQILEETGCSRSSLLRWNRLYKLQGLEGLLDRRAGGNNARLTDAQVRELCCQLRDHAPRDFLGQRTATQDGQAWTVEDLYAVIRQWYGVAYKSRTSYYELLRLCLPKGQQVGEGHDA